jgi:acyl carrier protein
MAFDLSDSELSSFDAFDQAPGHQGHEDLVRHVIAAHLEIDAADVRPSLQLERDLGITRLGLVLIGLDLEDLERASLPFERLADVRTVADLGRLLGESMSWDAHRRD